MTPRRHGRWLLAGGVLGLAMSPGARRIGLDIRGRLVRAGRASGDPVTPFLGAPCHLERATDRDAAARREAAI